jgi:hypothetical protein
LLLIDRVESRVDKKDYIDPMVSRPFIVGAESLLAKFINFPIFSLPEAGAVNIPEGTERPTEFCSRHPGSIASYLDTCFLLRGKGLLFLCFIKIQKHEIFGLCFVHGSTSYGHSSYCITLQYIYFESV